MNFIKNLFSSNKGAQKLDRDPDRYEREKRVARSEDRDERMALAKNKYTHQEILYYLAQNDPDPGVRQAVAENESTPVQATPVLARDNNVDVRMALAKRLVDLLPDLSHDKHSQLYAFAVQALGTLALDEVLKIRMALSSALKDHTHTPPKIAGDLARDIEREVSEPILRFCAALADADLIDILRNHPASWAVQAVAGREQISGLVSAAVIDTNDVPAGEILLKNEGAEITVETLGFIVEKSKEFPQWQKPIAVRKQLPPEIARDLAKFVDDAVKNLLLERSDFDADTIEEITVITRRRLNFLEQEESGDQSDAASRVKALLKEGKLNDEVVMDALAVRDREFVMIALAGLAKCPLGTIEKIFDMQAPKPVVAITWKAGLSMRTALKLQQEIARIPQKELIFPKGGTDYPLDKKELAWQLDFLGIEAA
ncbi:MAG: DUF2336 domain-containing protein [Alphaproteobacteria bacterium]|nr:DUF2336 domain-containing protein [Alphaproteobacteria bacterium]